MLWPKFTWYFKLFNYNENVELTQLIKEIIASDFIIVSDYDDEHYLKIETEHYRISMWNANKYYAWMQDGKVTRKNDGEEVFSWSRSRPAKSVLYDFVKVYQKKLKIFRQQNHRVNRIQTLLPL